MKKFVLLLGFTLGLVFAQGCDEDEGALFACGDDMCLSSEEFCAHQVDCSGESDGTSTCAPLENMDVQTYCDGSDDEGYHCSDACG